VKLVISILSVVCPVRGFSVAITFMSLHDYHAKHKDACLSWWSCSVMFWTAGGYEDWVVSCRCGTHVDDGERMVACDVCGVWMHTRCQGMPDPHPLPDEFVCSKCVKLH